MSCNCVISFSSHLEEELDNVVKAVITFTCTEKDKQQEHLIMVMRVAQLIGAQKPHMKKCIAMSCLAATHPIHYASTCGCLDTDNCYH